MNLQNPRSTTASSVTLPVKDWQQTVRPQRRTEAPKTHFGNHQLLAEPVEVSFYQNGNPIGSGKIWRIAHYELFVGTDSEMVPDSYVQMRFRLPGQEDEYRLWGRISQLTEHGFEFLVDILHPVTLRGLRVLEDYIEDQDQTTIVAPA